MDEDREDQMQTQIVTETDLDIESSQLLENEPHLTERPTDIKSCPKSSSIKPPVYCAKCFHSFCLPQLDDDNGEDDEKDKDKDAENNEEDTEDDDSVSPIFREDPQDVEELILEEIDDWVQRCPVQIWRSSVYKEITSIVSALLYEEWSEDELCDESDLPEIQEWVRYMVTVYFKTSANMPPRQGGDPLQLTPLRKASIAHKLRRLSNIPSPPQRTQEWYEIRYGLLTASNVWKALGTDAQKNQLITEKCQPFEQFKESCARHGNLSADNPMMLGQKYEPISALIYERRNKTKLGEYGCILHPEWNYLGASPDGINIDPDAAVYGRMVEIKNIVNRVIDGVPLDAYWVQMQMQMEVCDLEECDFVETRIKEYATKSEFLESDNEWRGVILTFIPKMYVPIREDEQQKQFYEYWMLEQSSSQEQEQTIETWIQSKKTQHANYVLSTVAYWGLDEYSCVLVKRTRVWFQAAMPKIEELWQTIERERITGAEHRAPKKREPKMNITITKLLEE